MQTVTELFMELVQIDSVSGEEEKMVERVCDFLQTNCHLSPIVDDYNNIFVQTDGEGEPFLFCAHLDTVEPGRGIVPQLKDGIITSVGNTILGADDKGAVAAILVALAHITSTPSKKWRPLDIVFTASEEVECVGVVGFDTTQLRARTGIIFDGTGPVGTIMTASPYYARFDLKIQGKTAHAGYPNQAQPAIPTLLNLLAEIEQIRTPELLINVGQLSGGNARNTIIGKMRLHGEIRSFDEEHFQDGLAKLDAILNRSYCCTLHSEVVIENPGYRHTEGELSLIQSIVTDALGEPAAYTETFGVSDANIFNQVPGLTVYNLGDGSSHAHTTREETSVHALESMQTIVQKVARTSSKISQEESE